MSITKDDVIRIAPEFSAEDDSVFDFFIPEAANYINRTVWGVKSNYAHALFTAHLMKSRGGATGGAAPGGPIASERVGDIATTYATTPVVGGSLGTTSYGIQFEQLRRTIITSPIVGGDY